MAKRIEYWTIWSVPYQVCTTHKTLPAAKRAARECESRGGATHEIIKVEFIPRRAKLKVETPRRSGISGWPT